MLISLLSGCTPQQEKVGSYLEKAELTEEEINILKLAEAQEPLCLTLPSIQENPLPFKPLSFRMDSGSPHRAILPASIRITFRSMDALPSGRMKKLAHSF